jgi:hypothetical protein
VVCEFNHEWRLHADLNDAVGPYPGILMQTAEDLLGFHGIDLGRLVRSHLHLERNCTSGM